MHPAEDLLAVARRKRQKFNGKSVPLSGLEEAEADGWEIQRTGVRVARVVKPKRSDVWFEDRVWTLLYRMGFTTLSGDGGGKLDINPSDPASPTSQLDVVGVDDDVAISIECKSAVELTRRAQFQQEVAKHGVVRQQLAKAIAAQFPDSKRYVVLAMFTENLLLNSNDRKRAAEQNMLLFDEADLAYYEALTSQIGAAARYQFLADLLPNKRIPNLSIRVAALRSKMGGYNCYTFSVSPEYLLKIAYVSHRAKGKASDVATYQRMLQRTRLKKIRQYIAEKGIFPTNIVISLEKNAQARFDRSRQEGTHEESIFGWLTLSASYRSAWIIDGQHRLYAYAGHPRSNQSVLTVLAFEGLPASKQAELFIDINAEQKSVKKSLLAELYSHLHWNSDSPEVQVRAVVSSAVLHLDSEPESPFFRRIRTSDSPRTDTRCISLTSLYQALQKPGMYFGARRGSVADYGPLWGGDNQTSLERTLALVESWFGHVRRGAPEWWALGAAEGGGLAMNDGVAICLDVLRSVFVSLETGGHRLVTLGEDEVVEIVRPYGVALGEYLGSLGAGERQSFRDLRGNQGNASGVHRCQAGIREWIPGFDPPGLREALELERERTSERATGIILRIEKQLQSAVLGELKAEFGHAETDWWFKGVPKSVRKQVDDRINEDKGERGGREDNLDLIHYREICLANWLLFQSLLGYGKGSKTSGRHGL